MVQIVTSPTTPTLELVYFVTTLLRWMTVFVRAQSAESLGWLTKYPKQRLSGGQPTKELKDPLV